MAGFWELEPLKKTHVFKPKKWLWNPSSVVPGFTQRSPVTSWTGIYRCQKNTDHRSISDWNTTCFDGGDWFWGDWLTSRLRASGICFTTFASSQTHACHIQERAFHMYEYYVGMTYQKNAHQSCARTLYFRHCTSKKQKISTSEGAVCLTTDPISGMHILPVMAQLNYNSY